jgi:membrane-bound lytic murein transglycosylase D
VRQWITYIFLASLCCSCGELSFLKKKDDAAAAASAKKKPGDLTADSVAKTGLGVEGSGDEVARALEDDPADDDLEKEKVELQTVLQSDDDSTPEPQADEAAPIKEDTVSHYEFPLVMNEKVKMWMKYFQTRGRGYFQTYLDRSTRFLPSIRRIFKEEGLPEDLAYLAMIESGFSVRAYSHAHCVGQWQFSSGTGKRYGLQINWWVDERRDPEMSTRAAAKYLKDLYGMFDSWYLAAASYNVGEMKIDRAIKKYRTRNFWELSRYRYLPKETKNYIPKLLAAIVMAKNPKAFGFSLANQQAPIEVDTIKVKGSFSLEGLADALEVDYEEFKDLNPLLRRPYTPPDQEVTLYVPKGTTEAALEAVEDLKTGSDVSEFLSVARELASTYRVEFDRATGTYVVHHGDTLGRIAHKYRITTARLRRANGLGRRSRIYAGQRLRVPASTGVMPASATARDATVYVVQHGDTLSRIAQRLKVSFSELLKANRLSGRSRIYVGQRLRIPGRTFATG